MKKLVSAFLAGSLALTVAACSPISESSKSYIIGHIAESVEYETESISILENDGEVAIRVTSTTVDPDEFGLFVEQAAVAILEAAEEKNVPIRSIDISLNGADANSSPVLMLIWSSRNGESGTFIDYRGAENYTASGVTLEELHDLVGNSREMAAARAFVERYLIDNSPYRIDTFGISESPSDRSKLTAFVITNVMDKDAMIVRQFDAFAEETIALISEAAAEVDLVIHMVLISVQDNDGNIIKNTAEFLP